MTRSVGHTIARCRGEILPKFQRQFKESREKKEFSSNQKVANMDLLQTFIHYDAEVISTYLL